MTQALLMQKVVATLPAQLTPNTLYFVRTGVGFDLFLSDTTGAVAYAVNTPPPERRVRRNGLNNVVGKVTSHWSPPENIVVNRVYFLPFSVTSPLSISGLSFTVTTAAAGTAELGIYANTVVAGSGDTPGALLAAATGLSVAATGVVTGAMPFAFMPGELYWIAITTAAAIAVYHIPAWFLQDSLGADAGMSAITSLFLAGTGVLPNPVGLVSVSAGNAPAIALLEV